LLLFRDDHSREALIFPPTLSPQQRRIVHTLAHHMGLAHISRGNGESRQVHVFRAPQGQTPNISPPSIPTVHPVENHQRRGLARATTMDFTDTRSESAAMYSNLGRQNSTLLDIPSSPGGRESAQSRQNLRAAKSFADLRSYTPSPVPSSASFPASLGNNISRYQQEYGAMSVTSTTPSLTPTATGTAASNPSESLLVNGLAGVSLTSPLGGNLGGSLRGDPRDPRGLLAHERERREREAENNIGGNGHSGVTRSFSMGFDEARAERGGHVLPQRQPRGPDSDRGAGFSARSRQHHSGRGGGSGGELDVQSGVEIVVE
jgi:hypothetical protein